MREVGRGRATPSHGSCIWGVVGPEIEVMALAFSLCRRGRDWLSASTF